MLSVFQDIPDPALIVLAGAAGSGKSLLAQENWPGRVVSSDALRELIAGRAYSADDNHDTFELVHQAVAMRMRRQLTTCVDATNVLRAHRLPLLSYAASYDVPAVAVIVWPPLETCLQRNAGRLRYVPEDVIRRQYIQLTAEMPSRAEGFAQVIVTGGEAWLARATEEREHG